MRIHATGIVQGVNFRYLGRRRAQSLGVTGWIRNSPDGSVEAVACGPDPQVDELIAWMRQGPSSARVDHLEVTPEASIDSLSGFEIH